MDTHQFNRSYNRAKMAVLVFTALTIFFTIVGIPLIVVFGPKTPNSLKISVESTVVKAYNLTSDDRLFCIINVGVRAHNASLKKYTLVFYGIDMEVRKGKHHKLADDALDRFVVGPGGDTVVDVEAVGLYVELKRKIAAEVRADVVAGEGRVNVFMSGYVGSDYFRVTCENVVVDFLKRTARLQYVGCGVHVTRHVDDDDYYDY